MNNENKESKDLLTIADYKTLVPEGIDAKVYLKLIKDQVMSQKLSLADFSLFLYVCKRTGLDPLTKQIHPTPYWSNSLGRYVMTIICGIDGFRLVAQRTGQYAGQDDVIYDTEELTNPNKATVTVYKVVGGQRVPFTATARWDEYVKLDKQGKPDGHWAKMPYLMLGKCAESLALRKAFPNELSGVYTQEEMDQSGIITKTVNVTDGLPVPPKFQKAEEVVVTSGHAEEPVKVNTPATDIKMPDFETRRKENEQKLRTESGDK